MYPDNLSWSLLKWLEAKQKAPKILKIFWNIYAVLKMLIRPASEVGKTDLVHQI